ncbi:HNH endonuclease signature motif containing protein [Streptacidiphilus sp. PAMC 29251]
MTVNSDVDCSIPDCGKHAFGRGWCSMHYRRWRLYGDPVHESRRYVKQDVTCSIDACSRPPKRRSMCEMHVRRAMKHGETTGPRERLFWAQVNTSGPTPEGKPELGPCWAWTGCMNTKTGYGVFGGKGRTQLAHRNAYEYQLGPIPDGLVLDHLCRRRSCVRPEHLEPVTQRENLRRGDHGAFWGYTPEIIPAKPKAERPTVCTEIACEQPVYKRTICRPHYRKWLRDPNVERPRQRTPGQRFWEKVEKTGSCWLWTAAVNPGTGYGQFSLRHGVQVQAHRHSFELAFGPVPEAHDVHHACHVRRCVNPTHLQALTRSQNLAERKVRR